MPLLADGLDILRPKLDRSIILEETKRELQINAAAIDDPPKYYVWRLRRQGVNVPREVENMAKQRA